MPRKGRKSQADPSALGGDVLSDDDTVALAGRARAEYRAFLQTINDPVTWEVFEHFLHDQFGPKKPVRHYTRKLMSIKQGSHEPVSAYCSRFRRTLLQLQSAQDSVLPDLTVVTWFQEGLRPEFQVELERDQPSKFTDAVRSAEKAESICQRTRSPVAEGIDHTECFVVHRSLPQKPSGSSRAQAAPITSSVTNPPDTQSTQLLQQVIVQQSRLLAQQGEVLKLLQTQSLSRVCIELSEYVTG